MIEMTSYSIPAYCDGQLVTLQQVLGLVDSQILRWQLTELEGITAPGCGLDSVELESAARSTPGGLPFSNQALAALADQLLQVINCELFGYRVQGADRTEAAVVVIRAMDSSEWSIVVDASSIAVNDSSPLLQFSGGE